MTITKESELALARIFQICDHVACGHRELIRSGEEADAMAREFLGIKELPTNKLDAFSEKWV